jgi:crotonobetainyl-CoA:carnitine CoA-transferase CaiB-like acyl-CoA transferase
LDSQVAWLVNEGTNYLVGGKVPQPLGNAHPNIVPYQVFPTQDGHIILACGNDGQYQRWCEVAGAGDLRNDPRYATNPQRIQNRDTLCPAMEPYMHSKTTDEWVAALESAGVPCGPVNTIDQVFENPQVQARGMRIELDHPLSGDGKVPLIANPLKMSGTPVTYRHAPPTLGQHTDEVLGEILGMSADEIAAEKAKGAV